MRPKDAANEPEGAPRKSVQWVKIGRVLAHAQRENDRAKVGMLVFVGDAKEEALDATMRSTSVRSATFPA
jgi:hypothetical protein